MSTPTQRPASNSAHCRCRSCGKTFAIESVKVTARYADCDMFEAPCCGATCDTRLRWGGPTWAHMGYDDMREFRRVEQSSYPNRGWLA